LSNLTYLQACSKVLLNLRENPITDLSASYSQLIGEFVNQAKEKVEAAWRWKNLTTSIQFTTIQSQTAYPLLATASSPIVTSSAGLFPDDLRSEILDDQGHNWQVFDATTAASGGLIRLLRETREREMALNIYLANQAPVQPNAFSFATENNVPTFFLVGAPQGGRTMLIRMKVPQEQFSIGTEVFMTPWRPIVSFATFIAMEERGEELSEKSSLYLDRHNQELERAIEVDTAGEESYMQLKAIDGNGMGGSLTAGYY
jgi:hypothetical protein